MKFITQVIKRDRSYAIMIGSRFKPDSRFKKRVKEEIDKGMKAFYRGSKCNQSVAIFQTDTIDMGEPEIPELLPRRQYLIFALGYSLKDPEGAIEGVKEKEIIEYQKEIAQAIEKTLPELGEEDRIRIAVILLYDCTVKIIPVKCEIDYASSYKYA